MNEPDAPVEVVIADDETDIRLLLRLQLRQFGISVVGEASDGAEAVSVCEATSPDVVILDLLMPGTNGFEAIPMLKDRCPGVAVVAYSAVAGEFAREEMARHDIPLRLKNGDPEPLVETIRQAAASRRRDVHR